MKTRRDKTAPNHPPRALGHSSLAAKGKTKKRQLQEGSTLDNDFHRTPCPSPAEGGEPSDVELEESGGELVPYVQTHSPA